jgi:carbamate kinase
MLGYMLAQSLANSLRRRGIGKEVACVLTQTVVDRSDPGFRKQSKPIGPFYGASAARRLAKEYGWHMVREQGKYRRAVASPSPVAVVELDAIRDLSSLGRVVVCAGGGGVPVVKRGRSLSGVDAVVDKDLTSSLLAVQLKADRLVILTDVSGVFLNYGKRGQRRLSTLTASECERYLADRQFGEGTMRPKIEASLQYVRATGRDAVIAPLEQAEAAVLGKAGTRITANGRRAAPRKASAA